MSAGGQKSEDRIIEDANMGYTRCGLVVSPAEGCKRIQSRKLAHCAPSLALHRYRPPVRLRCPFCYGWGSRPAVFVVDWTSTLYSIYPLACLLCLRVAFPSVRDCRAAVLCRSLGFRPPSLRHWRRADSAPLSVALLRLVAAA